MDGTASVFLLTFAHMLLTVDTTATCRLGGQKLNMLKMQWQGAGQTTGTVEGNTFTMENEVMVFAYKK
jgi:hypothetical protein